MKRVERARQWARHIEGWKSSGLTQRVYCEREAVSYDTFKRWRRRLRAKRSGDMRATRLVPVRVGTASRVRGVPAPLARGSDSTAIGCGVEIRLVSGRAIALGMEYGEVELARLIRMLEVLPC
jgi:hypothetical protein